MAIVALVPAMFDPWGWDRFGPGKWLLIAVLVCAGAIRTARRGVVLHRRTVTTAWLALLAASSAATLLGPDPLLGFLGEGSRLYGVASLLLVFGAYLVGCSSGAGSATSVARALVVGAAVVVAYGLVQIGGWDPLRWAPGLDLSRIRSTLGNAAFLGGYLTLVLPVAAMQWTNAGETRRWRVVHGATFAGGLVVMAGSKTRGAWVGLAVGALVAAGLGHRAVTGEGPATKRRLRLALVALAIGAAAVAAGLLTPLGPRALSTLDPSSGTAAGRLDTWANTVDLVRERPVLGWGAEGFRTAFPRVVSRGWVVRYGQEQVQDRAHNAFLDTASTSGVVGLLGYCALLVALAGTALHAVRAGGREVLGIAAGLVGYVVHTQFLFDTFDMAVVFWALAGVLVVHSESLTEWRPRRRAPLAGVAAVACIAVLWGAVGVAADHRVRAAIPGPPAVVVAELAGAAALRPRVLEYHLLAGRVAIDSNEEPALRRAHRLLRSWDDRDVRLMDAGVLTKLGALVPDREPLTSAASIYESIVAREPSAGLAWLGLGEVRLRLGEGASARIALGEAAGLLPRSPDAHLALGFLELAGGRIGDAAEHLEAARRIAPGDARVADLDRAVSSR
jgi:O-antigen ligase